MTTATASRLASSRVARTPPPAPRKSRRRRNFLRLRRRAARRGAVSSASLFSLSLPMFPGPRWLKTAFARAVRATKSPPAWDFTEIEGTGVFLGTVPLEDAHLDDLVAAGVTAVVSLNQRYEPQLDRGRGGVRRRAGATPGAHLAAHARLHGADPARHPACRPLHRPPRARRRRLRALQCRARAQRGVRAGVHHGGERHRRAGGVRALRSSGASRRCRRGFAGCRVRSGARCGARSEREPRRADTKTQIQKDLDYAKS